jgi:thymidylate kinase
MAAEPTRLPTELQWLAEIIPLVARSIAILGPTSSSPGGRDVDCAAVDADPAWPLRLPAEIRLVGHTAYDNGRGNLWWLERLGQIVLVDVLDDPDGVGPYRYATRAAAETDALFATADARRAYRVAKENARKRPVRQLVELMRLAARRTVRPNGVRLHLVGPDGTGKSTLAAKLAESPGANFKRSTRHHWRPGVLPRPGAALQTPALDQTTPHDRRAHGPVTSIGLLAYYWLDFLAGGWLVQRATLARSGLVVVERGWDDLAVDPIRYRLQVPATLVRVLGRVLPKPDLTILLEAPVTVLSQRKGELAATEAARQFAEWRRRLDRERSTVIDASMSEEEVLAAARAELAAVQERRAIASVGRWLAPPRLWLPKRHARAALAVVPASSARARRARAVLNALSRTGLVHLLPHGEAPPRELRSLIASAVPRGGRYAVARSTMHGRYTALVLNHSGTPVAFIKAASDAAGRARLRREGAVLGTAPMTGSIRVPRLYSEADGLLVVEPVLRELRRRPWELPDDVAAALGRLYRERGLAHGDFAPWNLLRSGDGWALVDWEDAGGEDPPFADVFHWFLQASAYLGQPPIGEASLTTGPVARALRFYGEAATASWEDSRTALTVHLEAACTRLERLLADSDPARTTPGTRIELARRRALIDVLSGAPSAQAGDRSTAAAS